MNSDDPARSNESELIDITISNLLKGEESANPQILSGDIVTVLEALPVYVIGGVVNPTRIPLHSELTVARAVASAGGLTKDADNQRITIFRRNGTGTGIIEADLEKIEAKLAEDVVLQPFDIVEVARKGRLDQTKTPVLENIGEKKVSNLKLPLVIID